MFRRVTLPAEVHGRLFLHSMPGCFETLEECWGGLRAAGVQTIVNLTQPGEMRWKSPAYAEALRNGRVPCPVVSFPVKDYASPHNLEAFWELAFDLAQRLKAGKRILIHCAAGFGRTGSLATCVLVALGETPEAAGEAVRAAGSQPGTDRQADLVAWCAARRGAGC